MRGLSVCAGIIEPMNRRPLLALVFASWFAALPAAAHDYQLGALHIGHPWARPTLPGQSTGGGYLSVDNRGGAPDRLLGGNTPAAAAVEVHEMRMEGDVMRMREIKTLDLPAGKLVTLAPGGFHLMLIGLKGPLKVGDRVPLKLRFERAGEIDVVFHVENKPAEAAESHRH
jgi:copper(I)-binding protein